MVKIIAKKYKNLTDEQKAEYDARASEWKAKEDERAWQIVRSQRDALIAATDWAALPDSPTYSQELLDYRQALRDIPQTYNKPDEVVWPINPLKGDSE